MTFDNTIPLKEMGKVGNGPFEGQSQGVGPET